MDKKDYSNKQVVDRNQVTANANRLPNEAASFAVEGHIKIFDPETKEIYVEKRA